MSSTGPRARIRLSSAAWVSPSFPKSDCCLNTLMRPVADSLRSIRTGRLVEFSILHDGAKVVLVLEHADLSRRVPRNQQQIRQEAGLYLPQFLLHAHDFPA